jgi:hypothetical protein
VGRTCKGLNRSRCQECVGCWAEAYAQKMLRGMTIRVSIATTRTLRLHAAICTVSLPPTCEACPTRVSSPS